MIHHISNGMLLLHIICQISCNILYLVRYVIHYVSNITSYMPQHLVVILSEHIYHIYIHNQQYVSHTHTHAYTHTYIYTYIYIHIYTYIYIHIIHLHIMTQCGKHNINPSPNSPWMVGFTTIPKLVIFVAVYGIVPYHILPVVHSSSLFVCYIPMINND